MVPVLECGELISYTIPSFSILTLNVRRIKFHAGTPTIKIVDGFIKNEPL